MSNQSHNWVKYHSPRNNDVYVEACSVCGLSKDSVGSSHRCQLMSLGERIGDSRELSDISVSASQSL